MSQEGEGEEGGNYVHPWPSMRKAKIDTQHSEESLFFQTSVAIVIVFFWLKWPG